MEPESHIFTCQAAPPRTLADMKTGQESKIHSVGTENQLGQRLMALGFLPGQVLKLVKKAPFGDPILVEIGSRMVSMRKAEARQVIVAHES
jgi:ferrous iron transport protein A